MAPLPSNPKILLIRPDRVGDVIITSSCFASIRAHYPDAKLYLAARPVMQPLFDPHPLLDGFIPLPATGNWRKRLVGFHQLLQSQNFDVAVEFHPDSISSLSAWSAGIPLRIGYRSFGLTWTRTISMQDNRREGLKHEALYNFDLLTPLQVNPPDMLSASIHLPEQAHQSIAAKLRFDPGTTPYVVVNLTAHSLPARWPAPFFAELTRLIWANTNHQVVLIGTDTSDPSWLEFRDALGDNWSRVHDLTGQTHLAELGALLRKARALVTRNTGSCHLAAAVECPMVEIFGRTSPLYGPVRWRSLSPFSTVIQSSLDPLPEESREDFWRRSFSSIPVSTVWTALEQILTKNRS